MHTHHKLNPDYQATINLEEDDNISRGLPERGLLRAILDRAILDLTEKNQKIRENSYSWFFDEDSDELWGSYTHICKMLNIEKPQLFRKGVFLKLKDKIYKAESKTNNADNDTPSRLLKYLSVIS